MDKIEYRAVAKYLFLKGYTPTQIKDELDSVYGDSIPSFTTVKFCAAEFKQACETMNVRDVQILQLPTKTSPKKTITGAYYASILDKLKAKLAEKRPHFQKEKILLYQDNAPSHASAVAMAKIHELRFKLLDHPPYLPDLAPSDFFLFSQLKLALGGQRFSSNEEAITFVNNYFGE
ncbi:histone-lysine N-methyltransferase SETMAR [Trichonephila clavipes]|nr:histone-lysine N-methyltransferase SETMAR [Trichonephila clavipes]